MVYNKIQVAFGALRKITGPFISYQYDVQQILVINGLNLPEYYEVDFCNEGDTYTETIVGTVDGVAIPNKFLRTGKKVKAYLVLVGDGDVQTRYEITLPVNVRPQRQDIDPTDDQQLQIDALVAALNSGVAKAEEAVEHYPTIIDRYWYVWDGDAGEYVSTDIKAEGTDGTDGVSPTVTITDIEGGHRITITDEDHQTGQSFDVLNGTDGDDGYSPAVTITTITGGHRITITDKDHPQGQSFDMMDGQGGGGSSDYTDLTNKPKINNVELDGNKTANDLGLAAQTDIPTVPVQSVNGKTGAVNLASGDIAYDESATYQAGSVGAELQEQNRQISDVEENQIPELKNAIDAKQNAPSSAGTAGQVLGLDANLDPVWVDQTSGGVTSVNGKTGAVTLNASDIGAGTYSKPSGGIPKTDLASAVQTSLGKADTALQSAPVSSVAGKTGAVSLDAGDIEFDDTETYAAGSIGAEVSQQKNAIDQKQDATSYVTLSGTIVTQTGADNTMYLCGELAELTFTAPATGQTAIRFTSGTTPTVATFSGVTAWLNGFDPTAIEASKTYEINILNGLGCAAWT